MTAGFVVALIVGVLVVALGVAFLGGGGNVTNSPVVSAYLGTTLGAQPYYIAPGTSTDPTVTLSSAVPPTVLFTWDPKTGAISATPTSSTATGAAQSPGTVTGVASGSNASTQYLTAGTASPGSTDALSVSLAAGAGSNGAIDPTRQAWDVKPGSDGRLTLTLQATKQGLGYAEDSSTTPPTLRVLVPQSTTPSGDVTALTWFSTSPATFVTPSGAAAAGPAGAYGRSKRVGKYNSAVSCC